MTTFGLSVPPPPSPGSKEYFIKHISAAGGRYGDLLVELMDECGAMNLGEITAEQAKAFFERKVLNHG